MHAPTVLDGLSDHELVVLAQENDDAAFAELMRRTLPTSKRLAVYIFAIATRWKMSYRIPT